MLPKFSVKKPFTVVVGIIIVIILGIVSYTRIGVDLLPSMNLPYIAVVTINPGAAPDKVEEEITTPIENGLSTVANINEMSSTSAEHYSLVLLEFSYDADIDKAYQEVNAALDLVSLPDDDMLQDPLVMKINPTMLPVMQASISREGYTIKNSNDYLENTIEEINAIDGVAKVSGDGIITNLAYININDEKIAVSIIDYIESLLNIELVLPIELKEELRSGLAEAADLEDVTPEMMVEKVIEILRESQQWNNGTQDNIMKFVTNMLIVGLENENSKIYERAIGIADQLIANNFILADNDENKQVFYNFCDQIVEESICNLLNSQIGNLASFISTDILKQLLYAQDFEMPSGSIKEGSLSYIVKIGEKVTSRSELIDMPVISFDVGTEIEERVDQLQAVLSLVAIVSNGKLTFSEGDLKDLSNSLYEIYGNGEIEEEKGIGYGTATSVVLWSQVNIPSYITENLSEDWNDEYRQYLQEEAPALWRKGFTANWRSTSIELFIDCFNEDLSQNNITELEAMQENFYVEHISDELAYTYVNYVETVLPSSILYSLPLGWQNTLKNIYVQNVDVNWSMPGHTPTNDLAKQLLDIFSDNMPEEWIGDLPGNWESQMENAGEQSIIPTFSDLLKQGIEQLSPDLQDTLEEIFRDRNEKDIENFLKGSLSLLKLIGDEAIIIPEANEEGTIPEEAMYTVDFLLLKQKIEEMDNKAIIPLTLSSIADITFLDDSANQITKLMTRNSNGELIASDSINISIEKEPDKSTADVTKAIIKYLETKKQKDNTFSYTILSNDGEAIDLMINTVLENLIFGGLLAVGILLLFLKDIRATITVGFSIVISVVGTFVMMYFAGITLNIVSMGGLALGVGMLVDNSIVVIENIYRMKAQGKNIFIASIQGAKQVSTAIIASTLTTVIVFLPIAFVQGLTKQIFTDMALTISFSLLASLFVAMTLIPMASSTFLKKKAKKETKVFYAIKKNYVRSLNFVLNHKLIPMIVIIVLFGGAILAVFNMDTELFPESDTGSFTINATIDKVALDRYNSSKEEDEPYLTKEDVENYIINNIMEESKKYKEIQSVGITYSAGLELAGFALGDKSIAATINMVDEKERYFGSLYLSEEMGKTLDDFSITKGLYKITVQNSGMMSSLTSMDTGQTYRIYGNDLDLMKDEAKTIKDIFIKKDKYGNNLTDERGDYIYIDGIKNIELTNEDSNEEYRIRIDKSKANMYGLTVAQVFLQVQSALAEAGVSHTLSLIEDDLTYTDYDVYIYNNEYKVKGWYVCKDSQGNEVPVYVTNNRSDTNDTSMNDYYITNTIGRGVYVENGEESLYVVDGGNIPVTRNGNTFICNIINGDDEGINIEGYILNISDTEIVSKVDRIKEFDIVTYGISSASMLDENAPTVVVPLYKLLDEDCFLTGEDGDIIYRDNQFQIEKIPLGLKTSDGYDIISHNGKRKMEKVTFLFDGTISDKNMVKTIENAMNENFQLDESLTMTSTSGNEMINDTFNTLYFVLILAILLIYLIMVAQFQSLKSPLIIMITIPLAFTGCIAALILSNMSLSVMALIGLIVLMGIVVNNGIVFVDYCNQMIENNVPRRIALLRTGLDRIRPIMMTAMTTIFALLIMALDTSENGAMLRPLAIATIGGLVYATILTLYFVPMIYDLLNKKAKQTKRTKAFMDKDIDVISSSEVEDSLSQENMNVLNDIIPAKELGEAIAAMNSDIQKAINTKEPKDVVPMTMKAKKKGLRFQKYEKKE